MPGSPQDFLASFSSDPANLAAIRRFVREKTLAMGFDGVEVDAIEMAVDEACANVIEHAYPPGQPEVGLDLCVKIETDRCTIIIADQGASFDPSSLQALDLKAHMEEFRAGGLGVYLMRTLMDRVDYHSQPGGKNEVRLTKFRMDRPN